MPPSEATPNADEVRNTTAIVRRKLDEARDSLLERNLRNKLVNCPLKPKRARQIRIVDEVSDEVFRALIEEKREFLFAPGRGVVEHEDGQHDLDIASWTPPIDEVDGSHGVASRHRDNILQTELTPEGLQKRLTALYYEASEIEEEQGVNVLYLALGFLKWFESEASDVERFAPLILLPVELWREGARARFKLKTRDDDLATNVSLRAWLLEQHSIQLPEVPEGDDCVPSKYFEKTRKAIAGSRRWEVYQTK